MGGFNTKTFSGWVDDEGRNPHKSKKGRDLSTTKPSSRLNETEIVRETMFWKILVLNDVA